MTRTTRTQLCPYLTWFMVPLLRCFSSPFSLPPLPRKWYLQRQKLNFFALNSHHTSDIMELYSVLVKPYSCSVSGGVAWMGQVRLFFAVALTCDKTFILQLPEEHSDFVQVCQGRLGVFQHCPFLFLLEERKKKKLNGQNGEGVGSFLDSRLVKGPSAAAGGYKSC